jgi:hypothetical protein
LIAYEGGDYFCEGPQQLAQKIGHHRHSAEVVVFETMQRLMAMCLSSAIAACSAELPSFLAKPSSTDIERDQAQCRSEAAQSGGGAITVAEMDRLVDECMKAKGHPAPG